MEKATVARQITFRQTVEAKTSGIYTSYRVTRQYGGVADRSIVVFESPRVRTRVNS